MKIYTYNYLRIPEQKYIDSFNIEDEIFTYNGML